MATLTELARVPYTGVIHPDCRFALVDSCPHEYRVFGSRWEGYVHWLDWKADTAERAAQAAAAARAEGYDGVGILPPRCDFGR